MFIDPPLWPRHGRVWGHMVSDMSLDELHAIARVAGIPAHGFDLDHYDVPEELHARLLDLGATLVGTRELVRLLHASGLRVSTADRRKRDPSHSPMGDHRPYDSK